MASSSPNGQQSSDLDQGGEGDSSDDDGEAIEVDPLTFCQPEMSSGGQGDFEESYEEQESDDDDHGKAQVGEPIDTNENENDLTEEITTNHTAIEKAIETSSHILKKVPSVQLTVVNRKRDRNEKIEKENGTSMPKVTITAIGSSQGSVSYKKEDPSIDISKKRKLDGDVNLSINGINSSTPDFSIFPNTNRCEPVLDHPIELRKLLFGDLAQEMCITVSRPGTEWNKKLSALDFDPDSDEVHRFSFGRGSSVASSNRVLRLLRQHGDAARSSAQHGDAARSSAQHGGAKLNFSRNNIINSSAISPEPTPMIKEDSPANPGITQNQLQEAMASGLLTDFFASHSAFGGGTDAMTSAVKASSVTDMAPKPSAKYNRDLIDPEKGIFEDPETGTIRYRCRNDCGVTLASAKGRRKHERRHCPKSSGEDRDTPHSNQTQINNRYASSTPTQLLQNSTNIVQTTTARTPSVSKSNSGFKCRFCGQLLTTLEGCKLHEKIQHANEISMSGGAAVSAALNDSNADAF